MRQQVCDRLRGTVTHWHVGLQSRYGDPRVYAQQQAEMNRVETALEHDLSRRTNSLLEDAYAKQREKNRQAHTERMTTHRGGRKTKRPPRS